MATKTANGITARVGKGGVRFVVRVRTGSTSLAKTFKTEREAKRWQIDTLARLNKGESVARAEVEGLTVVDAFDEYTQTQEHTAKEAQRIKSLRDEFAGVRILSLTPAKLDAWVKELGQTKIKAQPKKTKTHRLYNGDRARTYAASSIRKFFYTLKKVVEWHARRHRYPFNNPFNGVALPAENNERDRRFLEGEEAQLLATCEQVPNSDDLKTAVLFALETAMRAGEILALTWDMVNITERQIVLSAVMTKTKKARAVPLTSVAVKLLEDYKQRKQPQPHERIFSTWQSSQTLGRSFRLLCYTAKIDDFKFHDLRHEATSRFFERTTLRDIEIASITGHKELKMLRRYANLRPTELAKKLW